MPTEGARSVAVQKEHIQISSPLSLLSFSSLSFSFFSGKFCTTSQTLDSITLRSIHYPDTNIHRMASSIQPTASAVIDLASLERIPQELMDNVLSETVLLDGVQALSHPSRTSKEMQRRCHDAPSGYLLLTDGMRNLALLHEIGQTKANGSTEFDRYHTLVVSRFPVLLYCKRSKSWQTDCRSIHLWIPSKRSK